MRIEVHRGTNKEIVVSLCDDTGKEYKMSETESLVFGVKKDVFVDEYILSKVIPSDKFIAEQNGYLLEIKPEDTENILFGQYYYDIGLQKENGEFYIVVPCDLFEVVNTITKRVV